MQNLPQEVKEAVERLQEHTPNRVQVKVIRGKYYAFETYVARDRRTKAGKRITHYLGRIGVDGAFSPAKKRWKKGPARPKEPAQKDQIDRTDLIILQNLSMNARIPLSVISKRTGLKASSIEYRIKRLEERYGLRYIAEIDTNKLGFFAYMVAVRFAGSRPSSETMREALEPEPRVQFCMLTVGKYDMLIYLIAESNRALASVIGSIRSQDAFSRHRAKWYVTPFYAAYGYVPLRDKFFDLLKERVWQRSRENPRPKPESILNRDYILLRELNSNGSIEFSEIDRKNNLQRSSAQYTYHKLIESGLIKRITITVQNPSGKRYDSIIFMNDINDSRYVKTREELLKYIIKDSGRMIDRFSLVGEKAVPDGMMFMMPVFSNNGLEQARDELAARVRGISASTQVVTDIVVGALGYRLFDPAYTSQYNVLAEQYSHVKEKQIGY
ncbi:MAG: AsnC family transcriptional regulator [Candidatus Micrarchaeota archaeon]|nr:AsnC family transcriptional regulator [Candidatus Micrarchaeota archaeon]